jgi:hypothetical protein
MADVVTNIAAVLRSAGYRTGDANPGAVMPEIKEPVLAVNLERVDAKNLYLVIRVTIVSPLALGARACEEHGLTVCRMLTELGGYCELQPSGFNPKTEMFSAAVLATFYGHVLEEDWWSRGIFQVKFGSGYYMSEVVSFTAWQEAEADQTLGECLWHIRVEEKLEAIRQEDVPVSLNKVTVMYENGQEYYNECRLTGRKRIFKDGALHQIWDVIAQTRTLSN